MKCNQCPRKCNAERNENLCLGFCKAPLTLKIARAALHYWEEPCISGENGSGTVFFSGCSLGCVFCQNREISKEGKGELISVNRLAEIFSELENKGAHNINLVTPSHYIPQIIKALDIYKPKIPIVYNSGGYDDVNSLKMLEGYVDIFLMDLKYMSEDRAKKYSLAKDYPKIAQKALLEAYRQQPECILKDGIMQKGVIVRHLILPLGTNDAISVFDFVRKNMPDAYFSIMSQYTPCGNLEDFKELNRKLTKREYNKVLDYIIESGFENCYMQETKSSSKEYIPAFDLKGVKKQQNGD